MNHFIKLNWFFLSHDDSAELYFLNSSYFHTAEFVAAYQICGNAEFGYEFQFPIVPILTQSIKHSCTEDDNLNESIWNLFNFGAIPVFNVTFRFQKRFHRNSVKFPLQSVTSLHAHWFVQSASVQNNILLILDAAAKKNIWNSKLVHRAFTPHDWIKSVVQFKNLAFQLIQSCIVVQTAVRFNPHILSETVVQDDSLSFQ